MSVTVLVRCRFVALLTCLFLMGQATVQAEAVHKSIERVQSRIVKIFGAGGIRRLHAYSTGFVVSADGHIATIWSHVLDTEELTVVLSDGRRLPARVLGAEPQLDLAVLQLKAENLDLPTFDLSSEATDAASCSAVRTTFAGSITPDFTRSSYSPVAALKPWL